MPVADFLCKCQINAHKIYQMLSYVLPGIAEINVCKQWTNILYIPFKPIKYCNVNLGECLWDHCSQKGLNGQLKYILKKQKNGDDVGRENTWRSTMI